MENVGSIPEAKQAGINRIVEQIRQLSHETEQKLHPVNQHHLHSNDNLASNIAQLPELAKGLPELEPDNVRVGFIVGTGAVFSMLPEIPVDVVLIVDYDKDVGIWIQRSIETLNRSTSPDEYEATMYSNDEDLISGLNAEKFRLEVEPFEESTSFHFLTREDKFIAAKKALGLKRIVFVPLDLTDPDMVEQLADILHNNNGVITFANLTNAHEHIARLHKINEYVQNLQKLPFQDTTIIFASRQAPVEETIAPMEGLRRYLATV